MVACAIGSGLGPQFGLVQQQLRQPGRDHGRLRPRGAPTPSTAWTSAACRRALAALSCIIGSGSGPQVDLVQQQLHQPGRHHGRLRPRGPRCRPGRPGPAAERLPGRAGGRAGGAARRLRLALRPATLHRPAQQEQGTLASVLARRLACMHHASSSPSGSTAPCRMGAWRRGERRAGRQAQAQVRREARGLPRRRRAGAPARGRPARARPGARAGTPAARPSRPRPQSAARPPRSWAPRAACRPTAARPPRARRLRSAPPPRRRAPGRAAPGARAAAARRQGRVGLAPSDHARRAGTRRPHIRARAAARRRSAAARPSTAGPAGAARQQNLLAGF